MSKKANPEGMKWPTDKSKYDRNYLRLFGRKCPVCSGTGIITRTTGKDWDDVAFDDDCPKCKGIGYIEKKQ